MKHLRLDESIDLALNSIISFRVYADSRPRVLQTAKLQKGPVIICGGTELIEEGLGMGVPVCIYKDGAHFSLDADTYVNDNVSDVSLVKIYNMNGVASKRFHGTTMKRGRYLDRALKILERWYRDLRRFGLRTGAMLNLLSLLGMKNEYLESSSRGRIAVTYRPSLKGLEVEASFDNLSKDGLQGIVFANEASGRLFRDYADSTGVRLREHEIEPWQVTRAECASFYSQEFRVGFRLHQPNGWLMVRGREVVRDRISWSGLDLLSKGVPQALEYCIEVFGDGTAD